MAKERYTFLCEEEERAEWEKAAARKHRSLANWIRVELNTSALKMKLDEAGREVSGGTAQ